MRAISVTLKSAGKDIETFGENYSHQIKQIDAAFGERLARAGQSLDNWVLKLQEDLEQSSGALSENLGSFTRQVEGLSQLSFENHKEAYGGIQKSIENATASFETASDSLTEKLTEQLTISEKYQSGFQEMVKTLTANSEKFSEASENSMSSIESNRVTIEDSLEKFNASIGGLREAFETQRDDLRDIVNSVSEIKIQHQTGNLDREQEIARLTSKLAEITAKLEGNLSDTSSQLSQSFEPLVKGIASLTSKIDKASTSSDSGVFSKFFRG